MTLRRVGVALAGRSLPAMQQMFAAKCFCNGDSVFHLQNVLAHSSLDMTRKYSKLMTKVLQRVRPLV